MRGASHPEELITRASALGYEALAVTDECSMSGIVKAHVAAKEHSLRLIIGSEFHLEEDIHIVLLAPNRVAYGQICNIITIGRHQALKGEYKLALSDLKPTCDACLALLIPNERSIQCSHIPNLRSFFEDRLWISLEMFPDGQSLFQFQNAMALSKKYNLPIVASGDVHMHHKNRKALHDVLSAVRMNQSLHLAGRLLFSNKEKYLRPLSLLNKLYPKELLANTIQIADLCTFSLDELRYEYPQELVPLNLTPTTYLRQLVTEGATKRWDHETPSEVLSLIEKELTLIAELKYEYYFLTVFDIVNFARSQGILCQGRGSAANSAVCYCLGITEVDPSRISLLFERFISKERNEPPDIDVDFEHERREEVIQYIYRKYGRNRAAIAATVITYRPKSAIRDVGKVLGIDSQLIDRLAKSLSWWDKQEELQLRFSEVGINPKSPLVGHFLTLVRQILGFPRHLSQHVGGFVISRGPLSQLVPVENTAMKDRTIIQWDKNDLLSLGLLKIDVLALGMLTSIRKSIDLINSYRNTHLTLDKIPPEDIDTYRMLQEGDSIGVFQVESRAQISMLSRLRPKCFYDLVIEVAIVRPGPIQGNMVHPYLKRRNGEESVSYANREIQDVLERTLGVPIFQEQVIKLAVVAAGFSPGEADQLRRAMAAWKRRGGLEQFREKLIHGMLQKGIKQDFSQRIFEQIKGFGEYGFPESHAASFALLVYISAWLKRHEPAAFYCGLLNSQPMGFYSPYQLIQDAQRHKVEILPVDIRYSEWESTLANHKQAPAIRLGFQRIKGFRQATALRIIQARHEKIITSIQDITMRGRLDRGDLSKLTEGGAFKYISGNRYQTHWYTQGVLPDSLLIDNNSAKEVPFKINRIPSEADDLITDFKSLELTLGRHPMALLREQGDPFTKCYTAHDLEIIKHGSMVKISGIVTSRQRPSSASGVIFLTLEDETNNINVIIWKHMLERFHAAILQGQLLLIQGTLERESSVIHIIAKHVTNLSHHLENISLQSRDFH